MTDEYIQEILEKLMNGDLSEHYVTKVDFLPFRTVIVNRADFKNFRGIAQRGGDVLYRYTETPRS